MRFITTNEIRGSLRACVRASAGEQKESRGEAHSTAERNQRTLSGGWRTAALSGSRAGHGRRRTTRCHWTAGGPSYPKLATRPSSSPHFSSRPGAPVLQRHSQPRPPPPRHNRCLPTTCASIKLIAAMACAAVASSVSAALVPAAQLRDENTSLSLSRQGLALAAPKMVANRNRVVMR
jgi:hypothetical protein